MTSLPAPDHLLADTRWLESLARKLVGNDLAADLQQDVTLAALTRPQQAAAGRSWLAAVARNLAISLRRRRVAEVRRVGALPPREPVPSPAELVATAELQQRAVAAVLALPQVYRDTVLLRFLQGLSLQATALAMGVVEETVRTRQKRALAMLRAQLAPPPRERTGMAALVSWLLAWGGVMKAKHLVVGVAVLLLAFLVTVPFWRPVVMAPEPPAAAGAVPARSELSDATESRIVEAAGPPATVRSAVVVPSPAPATTATLIVRASWAGSGAPAAGLAVLCRQLAESGDFATTDAAGEARFSGLRPGDYRVMTHDWQAESLTLAAGEERTLQRELAPGKAASGIVLDAEQRPVAGAEILVSAGGTEPQWLFPASRSDATGRFQLTGLRTYALVGARHPHHGTADFRLLLGDPPAGALAFDVTLHLPGAGAGIRVRVTDRDGKPLAGAYVKLGEYHGSMRRDAEGNLFQQPPATLGTTDAEGRFAAGALPVGDRHVSIYRRGLAPHREVVHIERGTVAELHVVLRPGGVLTGTVRDLAGRAIVGASVDRSSSYDHPQRSSCVTDDAGRFRFDDLPAGENAFEVSAPDLPRQQGTFVFVGSETRQWDVVLQPGLAIRGRLVDHDGQPLADWWIALRDGDRRARTEADGRFVIPEARAEGNTLVVRAEAAFVPEVTRFEHVLPGDQEQTFVVGREHAATAWLRGRVVDAGGVALAGAEIELTQDGWPVAPQEQAIKSTADGRFVIGPLPPGDYRVTPSHPGCVFATVAVGLHPEQQRDLGVLPGSAPAQLVVQLAGEPAVIARARVEVVSGEQRRRASGEGGQRTLLRILPGRYRLIVTVDGGERHAVDVELVAGGELLREFVLF